MWAILRYKLQALQKQQLVFFSQPKMDECQQCAIFPHWLILCAGAQSVGRSLETLQTKKTGDQNQLKAATDYINARASSTTFTMPPPVKQKSLETPSQLQTPSLKSV